MAYTHRFARTKQGGLAGSWQCADRTLFPICIWSYDRLAGLLRVTRGAEVREFECRVGMGIKTEAERRQILPHLALTYARNIKVHTLKEPFVAKTQLRLREATARAGEAEEKRREAAQ
jgi:hypothetical protein